MLYKMQYSIRNKWRGEIELDADSKKAAKAKAKKQLGTYWGVGEHNVSISQVEEVAEEKVAA